MCKKLIIVGASGHGKVIADIARLNGYEEIKFLDDDINKTYNGKYEVIGITDDIDKYVDEYDFSIGIGDNKIREKIYLKIKGKIPVLIHPRSIIGEDVEIKEGTVVMANAVINSGTYIGKCCIINTSSSVDHDCYINDFAHICPGTNIAGGVKIGKYSWLGIGSCIKQYISKCDNCLIGAGSVVIKNIMESGSYVGVPTKRIK